MKPKSDRNSLGQCSGPTLAGLLGCGRNEFQPFASYALRTAGTGTEGRAGDSTA